MNEGVFISDLKSRNPPVLHVRMVAVRDVNTLPAAEFAPHRDVRSNLSGAGRVGPRSGGALTVDLQGEERFMATSVAGGFETAQRSVWKAA